MVRQSVINVKCSTEAKSIYVYNKENKIKNDSFCGITYLMIDSAGVNDKSDSVEYLMLCARG